MKSRILTLRFPSGRRKSVVESRYELARRIAAVTNLGYARLEPGEEDAAQSLIGWGMIERHPQEPAIVRWSYLHEKPVLGVIRDSLSVHGRRISHLSLAQRQLLVHVLQAEQKGGPQLLRVLGDRKTQRVLRGLEARGVLAIDRRQAGYWALSISPTWRIPAPPAVPAGTHAT